MGRWRARGEEEDEEEEEEEGRKAPAVLDNASKRRRRKSKGGLLCPPTAMHAAAAAILGVWGLCVRCACVWVWVGWYGWVGGREEEKMPSEPPASPGNAASEAQDYCASVLWVVWGLGGWGLRWVEFSLNLSWGPLADAFMIPDSFLPCPLLHNHPHTRETDPASHPRQHSSCKKEARPPPVACARPF